MGLPVNSNADDDIIAVLDHLVFQFLLIVYLLCHPTGTFYPLTEILTCVRHTPGKLAHGADSVSYNSAKRILPSALKLINTHPV